MHRISAVVVSLLAFAALAAPPKPADVARRLVENAGVGPGDVVRISGNPKDMPLLSSIAVEVTKAGGASFFDLQSDESVRRLCTEVPAERDKDNAAASLKLLAVETVDISVSNPLSPGVCASAGPARLAARNNAFQPVNEAFNKAGIRAINLGNGLEPSEWRAKRFGISAAQLSTLFWQGIEVDPARLKAAADPLVKTLAAGKQLAISAPNGTKLTMSIDGRKVILSDGKVTADMAKKGQTLTAWLPAGDVYLAVAPGTAEGKVVVDRTYYQDQPIEGLTLTIKAGKVVDMTGGGPGFAKYKTAYDAATGAKDAVGIVNIGVNPALRSAAGAKMNATPVSGVVTLMTGDSTWAGGTDASSWGALNFLQGATVTVDGTTVVDKGQLHAPGA
ncbi:MAG TPA: aminopeptidase [Myxococcaceae bacterium]|nr:aminopeptidase [Myxococcaceae bacterium]